MQSNTLVKLIIAALVLFILWTKGLPWLKQHGSLGSPASLSTSDTNDSCVSYAEAASNAWSSGVVRFANPPYDVASWSDFESSIDSKIRSAEEKCTCATDSCGKVLDAMGNLRKAMSDSDAAIRGNAPPPSDLVQRQEQIDNAIDAARDLAKQGK